MLMLCCPFVDLLLFDMLPLNMLLLTIFSSDAVGFTRHGQEPFMWSSCRDYSILVDQFVVPSAVPSASVPRLLLNPSTIK